LGSDLPRVRPAFWGKIHSHIAVATLEKFGDFCYVIPMDYPVIEERLDKIETKLAFLEEFLAKLQDETAAMSRDLMRISSEYAAVREKLIQLTREFEEIPNRRPPHY
jgi:SlyX protein